MKDTATKLIVGWVCFVLLCMTISIYLQVKGNIKVGDCVVDHNFKGGMYKVMDIAEDSYIMRAYMDYIQNNKKHPILVSKTAPLGKIDCIPDKKLYKKLGKVYKQIVKDIELDNKNFGRKDNK